MGILRKKGRMQFAPTETPIFNLLHGDVYLDIKISRRGELNSPFHYTGKFVNSRHKPFALLLYRQFSQYWKWGSYVNITGNLYINGNGDAMKKRANAIRPYVNQIIHYKAIYIMNNPETMLIFNL